MWPQKPVEYQTPAVVKTRPPEASEFYLMEDLEDKNILTSYKYEQIDFLDGVTIVVCSDREDEERNAFQGQESEWPHAS